jgi:hypothetical protein
MADAVTAARLVRLRVLLGGALAAATDQTATGRHVSVIFLDGVCELALHLAADQHDVDISPKHGFDDVYGMVAGELGSAWNRRSAKGVRELHRARNNLQHHGILPDADHVPLWASEVDRFVHSLVLAAFGDDLALVTAAEAVVDDDLRARLVEAEAAVREGELDTAVEKTKRAIDTAVQRFRSLRGSSNFSRFGHQAGQLQEFRKIDKAFDSLENFVDIAYLATDPGEWLWLQRIARDASSRAAVTAGDAHRAMSLALSWILRFEAFAARYPLRVDREWQEPSLDECYEMPRFAGVSVRDELAPRGEIVVQLTLDELPPNWLNNLHTGLMEMKQADNAPSGCWVSFSDDAIELHLPDDTDPASVRPLADELVRRTHETFEGRLHALRATRQEEKDLAVRYADVLVTDQRGWVTSVSAEMRHDQHAILRVQIDLGEAPPPGLIEDSLNNARPAHDRAHISFRDGELLFAEDAWAPDEVIPALEHAIANARETDRAQAQEREAVRKKREQLILGARDAFRDIDPQQAS